MCNMTLTSCEVDLLADGLALLLGTRREEVLRMIHNHPEFDLLTPRRPCDPDQVHA